MNGNGKIDLLHALTIAADFANNQRGGRTLAKTAPALTIAIRDTMAKVAPEPREIPMTNGSRSSFSDLIKRAEVALNRGDLDLCESLLAKAEKKKPPQDDSDFEDDWSEAADHKKNKSRASKAAAADDEDDLDDDGEDDDEPGGALQKLGPRLTKPRYPQDSSHEGLHYPSDDLHDAMTEGHQAEDPQVSTHRNGQRTRFDDHVDHVKERDQCSHLEAMQRARREKPGLFRASQSLTSSNGPAYKRASSTYESLVNEEIAKGCNAEVAGQRVMQKYGSATLPSSTSTLAKAESASSRLQARAYDIQDATGLPLEDCLSKARREAPYLVKALNNT